MFDLTLAGGSDVEDLSSLIQSRTRTEPLSFAAFWACDCGLDPVTQLGFSIEVFLPSRMLLLIDVEFLIECVQYLLVSIDMGSLCLSRLLLRYWVRLRPYGGYRLHILVVGIWIEKFPEFFRHGVSDAVEPLIVGTWIRKHDVFR